MSGADDLYGKGLKDFTEASRRAMASSVEARDLKVDDKQYWAAIILTRICALSASVLWVCPGSVLNAKSLTWDFESIAALCRCIFEAVLMLFYLGLEQATDDEWRLRIKLVHLSDCTERIRLFHWMGSNEEIAGFVPTAFWLRQQIRANPAFLALPKKIQKGLLPGDKATIFGKEEIITRWGEDPEKALGYYRFISNYVHCLPLGFHRTALHGRNGVENDVDKANMGMALDFTSQWISKALDGFEEAFANLVTFGRTTYDFNVLTKPSFSARDEALIARIFAP